MVALPERIRTGRSDPNYELMPGTGIYVSADAARYAQELVIYRQRTQQGEDFGGRVGRSLLELAKDRGGYTAVLSAYFSINNVRAHISMDGDPRAEHALDEIAHALEARKETLENRARQPVARLVLKKRAA